MLEEAVHMNTQLSAIKAHKCTLVTNDTEITVQITVSCNLTEGSLGGGVSIHIKCMLLLLIEHSHVNHIELM